VATLTAERLLAEFGPRAALTAERLLAEFGPRAAVARAVVSALIIAADEPAAQPARTAWLRRLDQLHGERPLGRVAPADLAAFCAAHAAARPEALLFAVHTYYALTIKLVAVALVAPTHAWDPRALHMQLTALESGRLLAGCGLQDREPDGFGWYVDAWTDPLAAALAALLALWPTHIAVAEGDLFKNFYHAWIPGAVRHALGEFYTPDWLAEHTLGLAAYTGDPATRCLDASCGSGTFLVLALRRARARTLPSARALDALLHNVVGLDLNPLAVLAARVNYLLALGPELLKFLDPEHPRELPVHLVDAVLHADQSHLRHGFDVIVGNPPHVSWRYLPAEWRRRVAPLFEHHGLFTLTGLAARHGGSQKDLAALFICVVVDQLLKPGGVFALVVHVSLLKTEGAGDGFRGFHGFAVEEAHDFSAFQPFQTDADLQIKTRTLSLRGRKGATTRYPVPYHVWTKRLRGQLPGDWTWAAARAALGHEELAAQPLRGTDGPAARSPWMCTRPGALTKIQRILAPRGYTPAYHAHVGAYTGGLNGCYWLDVLRRNDDGSLLVENLADIGKKPVQKIRATIEADLVHPLLRGRQTARWASAPDGHILVVQDPQRKVGYPEAWLRDRYPRTHAFLAEFAAELRARPVYRKFFAASDAPFYSMYGVRPETFAAHKVVWMEISATIKASLLGRTVEGEVVVPDHKVILVAVDSEPEGDYLAGVLNSAIVGEALRAYAVDNNVATNLLKNVVVPAFDPADPTHAEISSAARAARCARDPDARAHAEQALSAAVEPLWG
jgi:SAM-dependent methyltransferase